MAPKETSEAVAAIAGRILAAENPLKDEKVRMAIQSAIANGVICSSPSAVVKIVVPDAVVDRIGDVLESYFSDVRAIAGSAVAQADGDGGTARPAGGARLREEFGKLLSWAQTAEAKLLVGDEGCFWPVEFAREFAKESGIAIPPPPPEAEE